MLNVVIDCLLVESLESIGEMSLNHVEVNRRLRDIRNGAAASAIADGVAEAEADVLWKTLESSLGGLDLARFAEANVEQDSCCDGIVRIDGQSSQFSTVRILP